MGSDELQSLRAGDGSLHLELEVDLGGETSLDKGATKLRCALEGWQASFACPTSSNRFLVALSVTAAEL